MDSKKNKRLIYNIMKGERHGYYLDLPKVGRAHLTRKFYNNDTKHELISWAKCVPRKSVHIGGGGNIMTMINGLNKTKLMAVIALLVLNYFKKWNKKQSGGGYIDNVHKILRPMSKNMLMVIAGLLLLHYFTVGSKKMRGGDGKLKELLGNNYDNIAKISGGKKFNAKELLDALNKLFCSKEGDKQRGGMNIYEIVGEYFGGKCGNGSNALEVVGDKALDYSKDFKQFGCTIPEWGYNLKVNGPYGQTKCI